MAKLSYTTSLSTFKKGDNSPCYTAHIKHNGTVSSDDFIKRLAERSGEERERMQLAANAACENADVCDLRLWPTRHRHNARRQANGGLLWRRHE